LIALPVEVSVELSANLVLKLWDELVSVVLIAEFGFKKIIWLLGTALPSSLAWAKQ
jgi:hypothetical protein